MAGETTLTTLAESYYPYVFGMAVGAAASIPITYNFLVYVKPLMGVASKTWRSTSRPDIDDAIVVAEAADVTDASMTDDSVDISTQTIARSVLVTYQVEWNTIVNEIAQAGAQVSMANKRKIDSLVVTDTFANLTNESGDNTTEMTYMQHVSFSMEARTQWHMNPPPGSVLRCAMHPGSFSVLVANMMATQTSLFASTFGAQQAGDVLAAAAAGNKYNIGGVEVFVTARIPTADTVGKGNVYALVGSETGSCFGLAVKQGVTGELRPTEKKLAKRGIGYCDVGAGILRQEFGLMAVTAAA